MEKTYNCYGVLFEKLIFNDHIFYKALNIVKCNELEDLMYEVENLGILDNIYNSCYDDSNDLLIGYVYTKEELIKEYDTLEEGIQSLKDKVFPYVFIQKTDIDSNITITYKFNLDVNEFYKVAEYKNNKLNIFEEQIDITKEKIIVNEIKEVSNKPKIVDCTPKENNQINVKELYLETIKSVIGQDEAIQGIIETLDRNYNIDNYRNKNNILLIGPSGSGKTEIFRTIAEKINVPITIEDSEQYSAVGYQGANISDMLAKLYINAEGDLEAAQKGILVIDEIDKKASNDRNDISGERVLNSLLPMMEGTTFKVNIGTEDDPNFITFDTSYLTVVLLGAFSDLSNSIKGLGFNNQLEKTKSYKDISKSELKKYGIPNELLGRVSIFRLKELNADDLLNIMLNSKNSAYKELMSYAKKKKIKLNITEDALKKIANDAIKKDVGVRGIKTTLNEITDSAFFEVNMNKDKYNSIEITEETLNSNPPYILQKKNPIYPFNNINKSNF